METKPTESQPTVPVAAAALPPDADANSPARAAPDPGADATPPAQTAPDPAAAASAARRTRLRLIALFAALGGMMVGGTVEYFVGGLLDSTGWFGPTLDQVVEQQTANFTEIRAKLDALDKVAPGSPEAQQLQAELETLIAQQEKLTERTHAELRSYEKQVSELKTQALRNTGGTTSVDFWLSPGEGITVGENRDVFALTRVYRDYVAIVASGKSGYLKPGEFVEFPVEQGSYKVYLKNIITRDDGRVGFDLVRPTPPTAE